MPESFHADIYRGTCLAAEKIIAEQEAEISRLRAQLAQRDVDLPDANEPNGPWHYFADRMYAVYGEESFPSEPIAIFPTESRANAYVESFTQEGCPDWSVLPIEIKAALWNSFDPVPDESGWEALRRHLSPATSPPAETPAPAVRCFRDTTGGIWAFGPRESLWMSAWYPGVRNTLDRIEQLIEDGASEISFDEALALLANRPEQQARLQQLAGQEPTR